MALLNESPMNERGTAMLEALAVSSLLVAVITGLFLAAYFLFARGWVEYQTEQSLYCLAENQFGCQFRLEQNVKRFLPYGSVLVNRLRGKTGQFEVHLTWKFQGVRLTVQKTLDLKSAARSRDLRW